MSLHNPEKRPSDLSKGSEFVRIHDNPDDDWCEMVNSAYQDAGYRTSLYCGGLLLQKLSEDGVPLAHQFQLIRFEDKDGDPEGRYLSGEFKRLLMSKGIGTYGDRGTDVPFAEVVDVVDQESGEILTGTQKTARIPLSMMNSLILEPRSSDET